MEKVLFPCFFGEMGYNEKERRDPMLNVIFIDVDDTLLSFDGYVKEAMKTGFEKFGLPPYKSWMFSVFTENNDALWRRIEEGSLTFEGLKEIRWNLIFEKLGIDFDGPTFENFFRDHLYDSAIPERGAMKLLRYLHDRYILCAASNGPYDQQVHRLEIAGMLPFFDEVFVSENIGASKPSKEFFDEAFLRLNDKIGISLCPEDSLMLGDSLTSDMAGGRAYGMKTCFYNRKKEDLPLENGPDYAVTSLDEVKNFL